MLICGVTNQHQLMKNIFNFFLSFFITFNFIYAQCNQETINDLLIGIGFLKKFKEVQWSLNSNLLRFYK